MNVLAETVFGAGLLTGLMYGIEWVVACFTLSAAAFGIGRELRRRVEALPCCKRCGGHLQRVSTRDSNPRYPSAGYTEYIYVCSVCGAQTTMVEACLGLRRSVAQRDVSEQSVER